MAVVVALGLSAGSSQADWEGEIIPPTISVAVNDVEDAWSYMPALQNFDTLPGRPHGRRLASEMAFRDVLGGRADVEILELEFDPDPFVLNNILVTNNLGTTQNFTVTISAPAAFPAPNIIFGEVHTGVIRGGAAAATVATVSGDPIYTALIDGSPVATLQDDPFSLTASPPAATANNTELFGPTANAVAVTSDIGIQLRFSLTPGDTASIISRFDVVPEPTSAGLGVLALVAVALGWRRRR